MCTSSRCSPLKGGEGRHQHRAFPSGSVRGGNFNTNRGTYSILITEARVIDSHCVSALLRRAGRLWVDIFPGASRGLSAADGSMWRRGSRAFLRAYLNGIHRRGHPFRRLSWWARVMTVPEKYFRNNCRRAFPPGNMTRTGYAAGHFFHAAIYGEPSLSHREEHPKKPHEPLCQSKLIRGGNAGGGSTRPTVKTSALRYFNVAGAREDGGNARPPAGDPPHPIVLAAPRESGRASPSSAPTTHTRRTASGTTSTGGPATPISWPLNTGCGNPSAAFNLETPGLFHREISRPPGGHRRPIPVNEAPRRREPRRFVASTKNRTILGWQPKQSGIEEIIATAWRWHESHPEGTGKTAMLIKRCACGGSFFSKPRRMRVLLWFYKRIFTLGRTSARLPAGVTFCF